MIDVVLNLFEYDKILFEGDAGVIRNPNYIPKKVASKGIKEAQLKIDELCPNEGKEYQSNSSVDEDLNSLSNFSG